MLTEHSTLAYVTPPSGSNATARNGKAQSLRNAQKALSTKGSSSQEHLREIVHILWCFNYLNFWDNNADTLSDFFLQIWICRLRRFICGELHSKLIFLHDQWIRLNVLQNVRVGKGWKKKAKAPELWQVGQVKRFPIDVQSLKSNPLKSIRSLSRVHKSQVARTLCMLQISVYYGCCTAIWIPVNC